MQDGRSDLARLALDAVLVMGMTAAIGACRGPAGDAAPAIVGEVVFTGMCDASGAVPLSPTLVVVADDEDSVLRVYDVERGGAPLAVHDLSIALGLPGAGQAGVRPPETDLEGATHLGDRAYWITSHGRTRSGELRPERMRFFATDLPQSGANLRVVGAVYERLLDDLVAEPGLAPFHLEEASRLAPDQPGGLNVEGLTDAFDGTLLIGFRSPVPGGLALVLPLENAAALVDGEARRARFGAPIRLDLGGQGIRDLSSWRGRLLIAAGNPGDGGRSRLYVWRPPEAPEEVALDLSLYNPEGFFTPEERDAFMVLSDDGTQLIDGVACKFLPDAARKTFRAIWIRPAGRPPRRAPAGIPFSQGGSR